MSFLSSEVPQKSENRPLCLPYFDLISPAARSAAGCRRASRIASTAAEWIFIDYQSHRRVKEPDKMAIWHASSAGGFRCRRNGILGEDVINLEQREQHAARPRLCRVLHREREAEWWMPSCICI